MKKVFFFISVLAFVACTAPESAENIVVVKERVGYAGDGGKVGIGSQASVDLIVGLDEAWQKYDTAAMSQFLSESAKFNFDDGNSVEGAESFLKIVTQQSSKDTSYTWNMFYAFAVNSETDTLGGDWVNAGFNVDGTYEGEVVEKDTYNEWYYVLDGKVTNWSSHKRKRND